MNDLDALRAARLLPISGGSGDDGDDSADADDAADVADAGAAGDAGGEAAGKTFTQAEVSALIRREAAKAAKKAADKARADADAADAKKRGDFERLANEAQAKLDAALEANKRFRAEAAVAKEASKAKAESPDLIYRLIRDDLDYDDDGAPTNTAELIAALKKAQPKLFGGASATSGGDGGKKGDAVGANWNDMIRAEIRRRQFGG